MVKIQKTKIKIQEDSEDLQMGGIMFPKLRGKFFLRRRPKNDRKSEIGPMNIQECAYGMRKMPMA